MSDDTGIATPAAVGRWPLLSLVRKHGQHALLYLGTGCMATFVSVLVSNADVFIVGLAFDAMFNDRAYALPLLPVGWIPGDPMGQLLFTTLLLVALKVLDVSLGIGAKAAYALFAQRTLHHIRVGTFDAVQRLDVGFFDEHRTGEVMSVLNNDVNSLERFFGNGAELSVAAVTLFGSSLLYMALLNWQLALVSLGVAPIIFGVNHWFGRRHERRSDAVRAETGTLNATLETVVSGLPVVKAFGTERHEVDRVAGASRAHRVANWRAHLVGVHHRPALRLLSGAALVVTFLAGTDWVLNGPFWLFSGSFTAGELVPFVFYTRNLVEPVRLVAWVTDQYNSASAAASRVLGVGSREPSTDDATVVPGDVDGGIGFEAVSFSYPATDERVLDGLTLAVEPGETVGIVGETGAGKSTLCKLLLGLYAPDEGAVRLDGHDVRDISQEQLRRATGYVSQEPFIFAGTVRENVGYGADDPSGADLRAATKAAGAHGFVAALPNGYDTTVGERGVKLSGGQRQRIAIARAILADPQILVLDEGTANLDSRTEVLVQRSLSRLNADRTTFVVAHRLSTVRNADRILVVDDGRIVECGTHEDLLDRDGNYADLWRVQVGAGHA